ncbi:MAG TPA: gliding motility-associated C-terminal domain-containing protein [Bacteroidia bacterium]|nr:gliding motility-associated C-terminal domain-containing protein [Bacteroidia bacterium]HNU33680.1 gliding motility-associated C-terminal domain-containing protein [Bacteroidia bacterium]
MMNKLLVVLLFFSFHSLAQEQYVKHITQSSSAKRVRIVPSKTDNGFVIMALDSSIVYKIGNCGNVEWSKKLSLSLGSYNYADVASLSDGGYVVLLRSPLGIYYAMQLTKINASGNVVWSKTYSANDYDMFPYTITQDATGNLIMYGNCSFQNVGPNYNLLTKLDLNGNIIFTKAFDLGQIWGGCLNTSDGGYLMRTSSTFIKTDTNGNFQWVSHYSTPAYFYYAPVEVSDGYIYHGRTNTSQQIYFYKMDKQGNLISNNIKVTSISGNPNLLHQKPNGNFLTTYSKTVNGKSYAGVVEFDKDLNVVNNNLVSPPANNNYFGDDVCWSKNGEPIIAGKCILNNTPFLFTAKLNQQLQSSCDTNIAITFSTDTVFKFPQTVNTPNFTFTVNAVTVSETNETNTTTFLCDNFPSLQLQLNNDAVICNGAAVVLQNTSSSVFENYLWSTGEATATISVNDTGFYSLMTTGNCAQDTLFDTVQVKSVNINSSPQLKDTTICENSFVVLDATTLNAIYVWQDGSVAPTYNALAGGNYYVDISVENCTRRVSINVDECELLTFPNIFTPNDDAFNNTFVPIKMLGIKKATLHLFNRWGQKIYTTSDIRNKGWDGTSHRKKSSDGVYFWVVDYENYKGEIKNQHGFVHLISG